MNEVSSRSHISLQYVFNAIWIKEGGFLSSERGEDGGVSPSFAGGGGEQHIYRQTDETIGTIVTAKHNTYPLYPFK
ncbi:MAG: hypothetical protein GF311_19635 [Candidatus Lokiarchaeota archaeon]|nr:hypothetical protein [Candidatus Lokiarchaeota archaeon]